MDLPQLPVPVSQFIEYTRKCTTHQEVYTAVEPYKVYESKLREIYAQHPTHPAVPQNHLVPLFAAQSSPITIKARRLDQEPEDVKEKYILALPDKDRRSDGSPATVGGLKDFKTNFQLFSESALVDLDWSNVIAAGSAVVTALLPLEAPHNESKRAQRTYYHEILAPASDVDLFIYGLNEEQAKEKIKQIESRIRDSILVETTTVRTKNAITIVSEYPTRHVQIVLRLYKSMSEILTAFDVDCSCVAFDGHQVWATPRAISAYLTQTNTIDLTRRSPSYENRLSKYSHRGFEVYCPTLDRSRIDPTIFERAFNRVMGLARLLVLEKLPHPNDRDTYLAKRRGERGRPPLRQNLRFRRRLAGNLKDSQPDDVAEWVEEDDVSNYHTFTVPYGPRYNARKIERLLFTKDLLLNAEWNKSKDRETNLHRHPVFFGSVDDVIHDCCGFCPVPETDIDFEAAEKENKIYISGGITFLTDDPGRQTIGCFNPLTDDDWTEMAYVGNTTRLCQAIVDKDLEAVSDWFSSGELEVVDVNRRDHAGRTPLQLATMCSTPEIVQYLIDHGARIVSRMYNGMTALHISAHRGETAMVKALLERSEMNQEAAERNEDARKEARRAAISSTKVTDAQDPENQNPDSPSDSDESQNSEDEKIETPDDMTEGSFVKIKDTEKDGLEDQSEDDPDVYDVDILAWDSPLSPLHLAIVGGHVETIELLIDEYGADVLLPVKIFDSYEGRTPRAAILSLVLALQLPLLEARKVIQSLLAHGALPTQADMNHVSALHYAIQDAKTIIVEMFQKSNPEAITKAAKHVNLTGYSWSTELPTDSPLHAAIRTRREEIVEAVLAMGAETTISLEAFAKAFQRLERGHTSTSPEEVKKKWLLSVQQPIILAARLEMPDLVGRFIDAGTSVDIMPKGSYARVSGRPWASEDKSLLDIVQDNLEDLRAYCAGPKAEKLTSPAALQPDEYYLDFPKGSYQYWRASKDLAQIKESRDRQMREHERNVKARELQEPAEPEKKAAAESVISKLETLESKLIQKGAKSFYDAFPNVPRPETFGNQFQLRQDLSKDEKPYETKTLFMKSDLTPTTTELILQLFEAAWSGDAETVKSLCVSAKTPLEVAVQDYGGFTPFSIAVLRGHEELASMILEIAIAQYKPPDNEPRYRYTLNGSRSDDDSDYGSSNDDEAPHISAELVNEKFTVDDISTLADNVKSRVSPETLLLFPAEHWRLLGDSPEQAKVAFDQHGEASNSSLIRYAILKNDIGMLKFMIKAGTGLIQRKEGLNNLEVFTVSESDFTFAVRLGRTEIIGEIIRSTGAALPLQTMVETSGVKMEDKPTYYQGLSVHGKKRKDWADAGRGIRHRAIGSQQAPPLLTVSFQGNVDSAELFLDDAPFRRYQEFVENFKDDKSIQSLAQASGGINMALTRWLGTRSDLALHLAVMSRPDKNGSQPLVDYLINRFPDAIDVNSSTGLTPLQLAFELGRVYAAKALIAAGANQATRNESGENILHTILKQSNPATCKFLQSTLELLNPELIQPLLLEKCGGFEPGALTPLALFIHFWGHAHDKDQIFRVILKYSRGKDLEVMNGAGDYPIHTLVRLRRSKPIKYLISYRPEMLYWENATGMTPLDVASTAHLRNIIEYPPELDKREHWSIRDYHGPVDAASPEFMIASGCRVAEDTVNSEVNDNPLTEPASTGNVNLDHTALTPFIDRLLQHLATKHPGKRKLVSLLDANEIAKRLAQQQQQKKSVALLVREAKGQNSTGARARYEGRYYSDTHAPDEPKEQDEVEKWKALARQFPQHDLKMWEKTVRSDDENDDDAAAAAAAIAAGKAER